MPSPQTEVDFVIFGDLGQVETDGSNEASQMDGSILTTTALAKDFADGSVPLNNSAAVFHIGDISYARGYASLWEQFWYQLSGMSEFVPSVHTLDTARDCACVSRVFAPCCVLRFVFSLC